jgi:hypothetical protein
MYIPQNWEFGPAFSKLRNLGGGGVEPLKPPPWVRQSRCGTFTYLTPKKRVLV